MSNSAKVPPPSVPSKLGISYVFTKTLLAALTRLCTSPFKGSKGAPTYFKDVAFAAFRSQLRSLSLEQSRYLNKTTTETYYECANALNFQPESITLSNGVQAHWLGDKKAKITLVYLHGGGYAQPATLGHFNYLHSLTTVLNRTGTSISTLVLAYTLAPDAHYPTQLAECASLINHLILTENRSPSDLILAGDSAGGNLLLSLLSHILHPHLDSQVPRVELASPFRAALLLSPWVSFATDHPSFKRNAESDIFDSVPLKLWSKAFLGSTQRQGIIMGDSYSEALLAEPSWWSGAHNVFKDVMIWGGGGELLIDGIKAFAEKFTEGWVAGGGDGQRVKLVVTPRMAHEEMVLDVILGYKNKGKAALEVEDWIRSRL